MARSKAARKADWHRGVFLVGVLGAIAVLAFELYRRHTGGGSLFSGSLPWQIGDGGAATGPAGPVPLAPVNGAGAGNTAPITRQPGWEDVGIFGPKTKSPTDDPPITTTGADDPLLSPAVPTRRRR